MKVIGLDLAGKEKNPTGFCVLTEEGGKLSTEAKVFYYDKDILDEIRKEKPDLIAIDAPFTFPGDGYFREGDKLLMERGFRPLSPRFPNVMELVRRARGFLKALPEYKTIEVFTQASARILGMEWSRKESKDKFDALAAAITGRYFMQGKYEALGKEKIIIPKLEKQEG
jgi:hypothetical protein